MSHHLARVGAMGLVGQFCAVDQVNYQRGMRVVVRTVRGLESGEVLAAPEGWSAPAEADGEILRGMTIEDELLAERLERKRDKAFTACTDLLAERGLVATLVDVEHLLDGQGLYFYFLGEVTPEVDACTAELAETYEATVKFRQFTDTVLKGCGPGCGTEEAMGQGGCSSGTTCAVASACKKELAIVVVRSANDDYEPSVAKNSLISPAACWSSCRRASSMPTRRTSRAFSIRVIRASCWPAMK
ncbi:MAG: PSP1 C-terminal domain-containing protein [Aeoliella sp.]